MLQKAHGLSRVPCREIYCGGSDDLHMCLQLMPSSGLLRAIIYIGKHVAPYRPLTVLSRHIHEILEITHASNIFCLGKSLEIFVTCW